MKDAQTFAKNPSHGPSATFTGFRFEYNTEKIDYIFFWDDQAHTKIEAIQHSVCTDVFDGNHPPSDHRPITADFIFRAPSPETITSPDLERHVDLGKIRCRFSLNYRCEFGEEVRVVGSLGELGGWNADRAPLMLWNPNDRWTLDLELEPRSFPFEYKYIVVDNRNNKCRWELGPNRTVKDVLVVQNDHWEK
eukprot:TRINITY_DN8468_c0_g1_i1.p3 TRINITY_DN8468_c0_g1~~TRINITY_DN8468_c0_g1_i1.p3  ORF type:complete len:192 (+),score=59.06 TRINITY_DN8468_c0_g1_i1:659-1234(+)